MKKVKLMILSGVAVLATGVLTGCGDDYDDVAPGNWVDTERIETFPGDTVLVKGSVSNGSPITNVSLVCEAWGVNRVYDRSSYEDKVFNYEYKLIVPEDATFNQTLTVTARSENGKTTVREIPMSFLPDTSAPVVSAGLDSEIGLDFDPETQKAVWELGFRVADDRALSGATISIPGIAYDETVTLEGRSGSVNKTIEFTEAGAYPCVITVTDASSNQSVNNVTVMVMLAETENPIQDYAGMYLVDANENPDDYIDGYYRYMDRQGEYQYQGKFYASTDNAKLYFTPERNLTGDLYGVSPYVSSKLMNNNGYVVPVTIEKAGYYGIWIDLNAHSYSIWPLEIAADVYTDVLRVSGTGFIFGDWGLPSDDMVKETTYRYTYNTSLAEGYTGDYQYYFYSPDWAHVFRADTEGKWWFESASGSCVIYHTDYSGPVVVTFDSALPWATIKKSN